MKTKSILLFNGKSKSKDLVNSIVAGAHDLRLVAQIGELITLIETAKRLVPDVVILNLTGLLAEGFETARQLALESPTAKVLIVSASNDERSIQGAMEAGASGYLVEQNLSTELLPAIRDISEGNAYYSPSAVKRLLKQWQAMLFRIWQPPVKVAPLTDRQSEILQLIADGYANKQISAHLSISIKTVEKHRQQLMDRLGIHDIATLTRYAIFAGTMIVDDPNPLASSCMRFHQATADGIVSRSFSRWSPPQMTDWSESYQAAA